MPWLSLRARLREPPPPFYEPTYAKLFSRLAKTPISCYRRVLKAETEVTDIYSFRFGATKTSTGCLPIMEGENFRENITGTREPNKMLEAQVEAEMVAGLGGLANNIVLQLS